MTFEEKGGKTLLVMRELHSSKESLDAAGTGAADATIETFAQLDELLLTLGASVGQSCSCRGCGNFAPLSANPSGSGSPWLVLVGEPDHFWVERTHQPLAICVRHVKVAERDRQVASPRRSAARPFPR